MLVSAPAGFGKTTLLAEWLAARPRTGAGPSAAWLSLDRGDNDPVSFWTYVVAALRTVAPGVGTHELALLAAPQPPPIHLVLTTLLNDLGTTGDDLVLVLEASPDAVGYGLRMLRTAGLVVNRRAGRVIYYRLAEDFPAPLREHCLRRLVELTRTSDGEELLTEAEVER